MAHQPEKNEKSERRVLNLKAAAIVGGLSVLASIAIGRIHASQVGRTSEYLKTTAEQAHDAEEYGRAFDLYEQYMTLNPLDVEIEEKISVLLEEEGNSAKSLQRAFGINERLLMADKSRDDIRLRQISIADRLGRYVDAAIHLKVMRDKRPDLSDVWHFSGIVAHDTGSYQDAIAYFQNSIARDNPKPEAYQYLADLLTREQNEPQQAFTLLGRLIEQDDSPEARVIRARWLITQKRFEESIPDLWVAVDSEKDDAKINAMLLKSIRKARQQDTAFNADWENRKLIDHLNEVLSESPDLPRLRLYLSSALWATGQRDAAIDNLKYGISRDPRQFEMYEVLVDYLVSTQRNVEARETFAMIPDRIIDRGRREFMFGRILMSERKWDDAISAFGNAIGFAQEDDNIISRSRICLAVCRRESGDNQGALDALTSLIQTDPDFEGGRIGIASAYLQANQIPMAIAEYKQLLHVDGVPPFLANLMIKYNLTLPPSQREWEQVAVLLRDEDPHVADPVQRALLKADLLFAEGFPAKAMDQLDRIERRMPGRTEVQRARQRLSTVHGERLIARVRDVLNENPRSMEGHISMLRLLLARNDTIGLDRWLTDVAGDTVLKGVGQIERLRLVAEAATTVADAELVTRGSGEQLKVLQDHATRTWTQLASQSGSYVQPLVRFVANHRSATDAIQISEQIRGKANASVQAACWLECLKVASANTTVQRKVHDELVRLITADQTDMSLRLAYAESRILMQDYDAAEKLLNEILRYDQQNSEAYGRLAWISLLVRNDIHAGLEYSARASGLAAAVISNRSIRSLALAESGQPDNAILILKSIPASERTVESYLFESRALYLAGREALARDLVLEISQPKSVSRLDPAEVRLLTRLQESLQVQSRHMTDL